MWLGVHGPRWGIWKRRRFEEDDADFRVSPLSCQCSETFQSFLQASLSWAAGKGDNVPWGTFSLEIFLLRGCLARRGPLFSSSISEVLLFSPKLGSSRGFLPSHEPPLLLHRSLDWSREGAGLWQSQEVKAHPLPSLLR